MFGSVAAQGSHPYDAPLSGGCACAPPSSYWTGTLEPPPPQLNGPTIMMNGIRKAGQSWLGKLVVGVLFSVLIVSFAVWGIGDIVRQGGKQLVAEVGPTEITTVQFRDAWQQELQQVSRRIRRTLTSDEARAFGLDKVVLDRMMTDATLNAEVKKYGLGISEETIARAIQSDPNFRGTNGQFDRNAFQEAVRNAGYTEQGFVTAQRGAYLRQQLTEAMAGAAIAPLPMREALHRYRTEQRAIDFFVLDAAQAGDIPAPSENELKKFYEENKNAFRAPDFRSVNIIALTPDSIAKPNEIWDADAKAFYDRNLSRFGQPERRQLEQIPFANIADAEAAAIAIKSGKSLDDIAAEKSLKPIDLGNVTKGDLVDPAVAEAAFALKEGETSGTVNSRFGPLLLRVKAVTAGAVKPFEEVAAAIKYELARTKARDAIQDLHDKIEDQRASAKPLADIAREITLTLESVAALDRQGRDASGTVIPLPDREALLKAIFASEIGADNEPIATRDGGWVWYDVTGITPSRDRTLDEIRPILSEAWKIDETAQRLAKKVADAAKAINGGKSVADVARENGVESRNAIGLTRGTQDTSDLSQAAITQAFGTKIGEAAPALGKSQASRIVLKVTSAIVPALDPAADDAKQLESQIKSALSEDMLVGYVANVQKSLGTKIYDNNLRLALGTN